jgi:hypothetical protein
VSDPFRDHAILHRQIARLRAVLRVLFVLVCVAKPELHRVRTPAADEERLLQAVDRTSGVLGLRRLLSLFGLSAARLHAWRVAAGACALEEQPACPRSSPQRLTLSEVSRLRFLVTSDDDLARASRED